MALTIRERLNAASKRAHEIADDIDDAIERLRIASQPYGPEVKDATVQWHAALEHADAQLRSIRRQTRGLEVTIENALTAIGARL